MDVAAPLDSPPRKPHPLFLFLLLGVPVIGLGVMAYLGIGIFGRWWPRTDPPAAGAGASEPWEPTPEDPWMAVRRRTDALSRRVHAVNGTIFDLEERLAGHEAVDFDLALRGLDELAVEAAACDVEIKALLAAIQTQYQLADVGEAIRKANTMNTPDGSNIGTVINSVARRVEDLETHRRRIHELRRTAEGKGSAPRASGSGS